MCPELLMNTGKITGRSDQYSLAVTLYEMLAKTLPHRGSSTIQIVRSMSNGHMPLTDVLPGFPPAASEVVDRALNIHPENRFDTCSQFASAFRWAVKLACGPLSLEEKREYYQHQEDDVFLYCLYCGCLLYTSPSPRDLSTSRMPSSA